MPESTKMTLWRSEDGRRWFLVPENVPLSTGSLSVLPLVGEPRMVDPAWLARFEIGKFDALAWAKHELNETLGQFKRGIDDTLSDRRTKQREASGTPVAADTCLTPDAPLAILALLRSLPAVTLNSFSRNEELKQTARNGMAELEERLHQAGIDVTGHLTRFAERVQALRATHRHDGAKK